MSALPAITLPLTELEGEPRVRDLDLAKTLGFERPRNIRKLVTRHWGDLERFGPICSVRSKPGDVGRPSTEYWLNEEHSVYLTAKSDTSIAADITVLVVRTFTAWRRRPDLLPNFGENPALPANTLIAIDRTFGVTRQMNGRMTRMDQKVDVLVGRESPSSPYKPPLQVLQEHGVEAKGRRTLSQRASSQMKLLSNAMGVAIEYGQETGKPRFHDRVIARWLEIGGRLLIAQHKAAVAGQLALPFPRKA